MAKDRSIVKLACSNLWKVYGGNTGYYFDTNGYRIDAAALAQRMRREKHIPAVADVSLEFVEGEIFVIMGLSGSGKSTVLRCLSRLVAPSYGRIALDGEDLSAMSERQLIDVRRHRMGMVFQNFGLLPHLSVIDNVAFPLKVQGRARQERLGRAREMIELVGLAGREDAYPRELSGGQQQRVGIARSLAVEPEVWFLDEPFSALDPLIRRQMQDEFLRLQRQLHKTIVFVTHDFLEALRLADRICVMKDGFVVQVGTPEDIVMRPVDDYVRAFIADAPLARVMRTGAVMGPRAEPQDGTRPAIAAAARLDEAMKLYGDGADVIDVMDEAGHRIGSLSAARMLRALARQEGTI